eukprot:CAMPEP_0178467976 /NCGR_PEP_ID=MMETSP0689_2-20121128/52685_1 /TAXON_ID=160604 /ORGANISM="Amphidinium massartii, Strain CS-259" /LENGTH=327 /DNA_ID=CAMNT_0020095025 /DNA_START=99 /DNA_END=1079 /DNA_ORIENTATION=-
MQSGFPAVPCWRRGAPATHPLMEAHRGVQSFFRNGNSTLNPVPAPAPTSLPLLLGSAVGVLQACYRLSRGSQSNRRRRGGCCRAVPLTDLLPKDVAWSELARPQEDLVPMAAELSDLELLMELAEDVFGGEPDEVAAMENGLGKRLGSSQSLIGARSAVCSATLARPLEQGSSNVVDTGLVLAYWDVELDAPIAMVDVSLWQPTALPRAPGARVRPQGQLRSQPYILNLGVDPLFRRRGLGRKLMDLTEKVLSHVWGDSEVFLHVEKKETVAEAFWEAMGYKLQTAEEDPEFRFTDAERRALQQISWRRKELPPADSLVTAVAGPAA